MSSHAWNFVPHPFARRSPRTAAHGPLTALQPIAGPLVPGRPGNPAATPPQPPAGDSGSHPLHRPEQPLYGRPERSAPAVPGRSVRAVRTAVARLLSVCRTAAHVPAPAPALAARVPARVPVQGLAHVPVPADDLGDDLAGGSTQVLAGVPVVPDVPGHPGHRLRPPAMRRARTLPPPHGPTGRTAARRTRTSGFAEPPRGHGMPPPALAAPGRRRTAGNGPPVAVGGPWYDIPRSPAGRCRTRRTAVPARSQDRTPWPPVVLVHPGSATSWPVPAV